MPATTAAARKVQQPHTPGHAAANSAPRSSQPAAFEVSWAAQAAASSTPLSLQPAVFEGSWAARQLQAMRHRQRSSPARAKHGEVPGLHALDESPDEKKVVGPSGKVYAGTSFFCLLPGHQPRKLSIQIAESALFDPLILLTILANCATMAWESPLDPGGTLKAEFIGQCEAIFLAIFTCELVIKVSAYGLICHREAYLHDPWCQLDFVVVGLAWLPILFPSFGNYAALRAFRALRPLRALKRVPGMPVLVQWILSVLPKMGNVLMLCGFIFLVFGIVGMELFKGSLHYRCALPGFQETPGHPTSELRRLEEEGDARFDTGLACHPTHAGLANATCEAHPGTTCSYFDDDPGHGMISFDAVPLVFLSYMRMTTFDDWADPMYSLMASFSPNVWVYFVLGVVFSGFFVVNLFLAVIFMEYGAAQEQTMQQKTATSRAESPTRTSSREEMREHRSFDSVDSVKDGGKQEEASLIPTGDALSDGLIQADESYRKPFRLAAQSDWLGNVSTALVVVNMLLMCMPYEGMSERYEARLEDGATLISWIFIIEMVVKLIGLGCSGYWSDGWNCLDGTIVSLSVVEMLLTALLSGLEGVNISFFRILRMLRMLRVLRILRLMRSWRGLYSIISTFIKAIPQMSNLVFLILLTMFMFALLGMQLFGGIFIPDNGYSASTLCPGGVCPDGLEAKPYYHFDYCVPAMLTIFILLTGEWIDAMEPVVGIMGTVVSAFYILVVLIGKYLLINLLVAVILHEFASEDDGPATSRSTGRSSSSEEHDGEDHATRDSNATRASVDDRSLCLFGTDSSFRKFCSSLIKRPQFDQVVILAILISSACLAIDSPRLDPMSPTSVALRRMDLFFTGLFFCEMSMKIISVGFACNGPQSYIRNAWNQVDFVIVMISLVVLLAESVPQLRPLRVLRVMRVLRPLRLISRNAGMKLIITSLFKAMPAVGNVFGVILALQLVFAILGMQMFSGEFGYCNDPTIMTQSACVAPSDGHGRLLRGGGGSTEIVFDPSEPLHWTQRPSTGSFDNFADAMRLLYVMSSGDQWELQMFKMMGASGRGHAEVRNDFSPKALFPVVWMFVGYIFASNLFVGVVVDNFSRMQKEEDGSATITPEQQQWAETMQALAKAMPVKAQRPPPGWLRSNLYKFINSQGFDGFITGVIIANVIVMAGDYWGIEQDPHIFHSLNSISLLFGMIYYVECVLKLTALGPSAYFGDNWCRFDFFLVCTSLLDQFASELLAQVMPLPPMLLRVLRVLRILRILRLLKGAKELRDLIVTMVLSFPSLFNVGSLLALIIFIYSVLGVNFFTFVNPNGEAGGLTEARNFASFGSTFLLLFQCLTGDGWSSIMADAMVDESSGHCSEAEGNCGSTLAIPYFISFQICGSFVFLNLVVAVILENFEKMSKVNTNLVSASDLELFSECWAEYDPDADNYIPASCVPDLLLRLPKPLGVKGRPRRHAVKMCLLLRLQTVNGEVAFSDLLNAIINNNYLRAGANLDEFKEVVPGVIVPPLAIDKMKRGGETESVGARTLTSTVPLDQIFGQQIFEQEHVKAMLRRMLARARARITLRGGPADPNTYEVVYVKGGYANEVRRAEAMAAREQKLAARRAARAARDEAARTAQCNSASPAAPVPSRTPPSVIAGPRADSKLLAIAKAKLRRVRESMSPPARGVDA